MKSKQKVVKAWGLTIDGQLLSEAHFYRKDALKRRNEIYAHTIQNKAKIIRVEIRELK